MCRYKLKRSETFCLLYDLEQSRNTTQSHGVCEANIYFPHHEYSEIQWERNVKWEESTALGEGLFLVACSVKRLQAAD